jgi:DNA-binding MarR family transcriptional regulator
METTRNESATITDQDQQVLYALSEAAEPVGGKQVSGATGLDDKTVTRSIKTLKDRGYVESPARTKYTITDEGKKALVY